MQDPPLLRVLLGVTKMLNILRREKDDSSVQALQLECFESNV